MDSFSDAIDQNLASLFALKSATQKLHAVAAGSDGCGAGAR